MTSVPRTSISTVFPEVSPSSISPGPDMRRCRLESVPLRFRKMEVTDDVKPAMALAEAWPASMIPASEDRCRSEGRVSLSLVLDSRCWTPCLAARLAPFRFFSSAFAIKSSTSPIPIPAPTHHHHPSQVCHSIAANKRCCSHSIPSSATSTKLQLVLTTARDSDPTPNTAVPPSMRHARRRLTKKTPESQGRGKNEKKGRVEDISDRVGDI